MLHNQHLKKKKMMMTKKKRKKRRQQPPDANVSVNVLPSLIVPAAARRKTMSLPCQPLSRDCT